MQKAGGVCKGGLAGETGCESRARDITVRRFAAARIPGTAERAIAVNPGMMLSSASFRADSKLIPRYSQQSFPWSSAEWSLQGCRHADETTEEGCG